jgi:hypothetical protein
MPVNQGTGFLRRVSEVVRGRGSFASRGTRPLFAAILAATVALAAGAASAAQLTLDWVDNSDGTAAFQIERKTWTADAFAQIATTGAGVATYVDATVPAGTTFCYRVQAVNSGGTSGYSNEACGVAMFSDDSASVPHGTPSLGLIFVGFSSDRVARAPGTPGSDGSLDGTFTLTLAAGSGARTVTQLDLRRTDNSGIWDTLPGNIFWTLGVASSFGGSLLNAGDGTVNFEFLDGSSVTLFAADKGGSFTAGSSFTLTATFSDGSTAAATATAR